MIAQFLITYGLIFGPILAVVSLYVLFFHNEMED